MNRERKAFTLVELLVVIAIIGILVSLLLPAIQSSRESARRATCTNQMRQLVMAVLDYEMAHEHIPAGTINPSGPIRNLPTGQHISWIAQILPYIEETALYDNLDLSLSAYSPKNDRARQTTIRLLICPSNPSGELPYTSYAGCHNDKEAPIDTDNMGVLFLNSHITRDDLKDGAAYTLFLGEKEVDDYDLGWLSGTRGTLRNTGWPLNDKRIGVSVSSSLPWWYPYPPGDEQWQWSNVTMYPMTGAPAEGEPGANAGEGEAKAGAVEAPAAAAAPADATANKTTDPEWTPDAQGFLPHSRLGGNSTKPLYVGGFGSNHVGGVNFALGDGSVRFTLEDASAGLMGRLANREDGQIIDAREW